jgi:murein DD-endopeptidase MepM/ murein hydrolase activator NlpD
VIRGLLLLVPVLLLAGVAVAGNRGPGAGDVISLEPVAAVGIRTDTLLLGGFASGSFTEAMRTLASDLTADERLLVGQHLDRIFGGVLDEAGLGRVGHLRVAYERSVRPDASTRSIRVLSAEAGVGGRLHTAYYFEHDGRPGYFDPFGHSLDPEAWGSPLAAMRVTSSFGANRMHPILGRILPHTGVDFAAPQGEPVRATADGVVVDAGARGGYGVLVEVRHPNGFATRYAHLSRLAPGMEPGRAIRRGEVVGFVGMTGLATGPHLHYEVRRRGQPVDPLRLTDSPAGDVGADTRWNLERQRLSSLLARTPTVLQRNRGPLTAGG